MRQGGRRRPPQALTGRAGGRAGGRARLAAARKKKKSQQGLPSELGAAANLTTRATREPCTRGRLSRRGGEGRQLPCRSRQGRSNSARPNQESLEGVCFAADLRGRPPAERRGSDGSPEGVPRRMCFTGRAAFSPSFTGPAGPFSGLHSHCQSDSVKFTGPFMFVGWKMNDRDTPPPHHRTRT